MPNLNKSKVQKSEIFVMSASSKMKYGLLSVLNWFKEKWKTVIVYQNKSNLLDKLKSSVAGVATFDEMKFDSCYLIDL